MLNKGFSGSEDFNKSEIEQVLAEIQKKSIFPILDMEFLEIKDTFFTLFNYYDKLNGNQIFDILQILCELNEVIEKINLAVDEEEYKKIKLFFCKIYLNYKLKLNIDQIEAIVREDNVLQIDAGAGTGKTTTLVLKVKYLIEVKEVKQDKILCLSFSNESVNDLDKTLNKYIKFEFGKKVDVLTFHKFGYSFFKDEVDGKIEEEDLKERFKDFIIKEIHKNYKVFEEFKINFPQIFNNRHRRSDKDKKDVLIKNKGRNRSYDFETLKKGLVVKSKHDLRIADFLFLNNIEFDYLEERTVDNETVEFDFYLKKYGIYLEDLRLDENGQPYNLSNSYEINKFRQQLRIKKNFIKDNEDKIILINSALSKDILKDLKKELNDKNIQLKFHHPSYKSYRKTLQKNKFLDDLDFLSDYFIHFIENFKQHNLSDDKMEKFKGYTGRERFFLRMVAKFYKKYQDDLNKNNQVDYNDMIIRGAKSVKNTHYDYIFVDEYQDISKIRLNLLKAVKNDSNAKLIVVGDKNQAIYGFTGCDVSYFDSFKEDFNTGTKIYLKKTNRFSNELIEISDKFIGKKSNLISDKNINHPIEFRHYSSTYNPHALVYCILEEISNDIDNENNNVLILSRYNKYLDELKIKFDKDCVYDNFNLKIKFSTIHSAKGLESDYVILINFNDDDYGIPSNINEEKIFRFVSFYDENKRNHEGYSENTHEKEEERLFYVALTRTRNKNYICCEYGKESEYYLDLKQKAYPNENLISEKQFKPPSRDFNPLRTQVKNILDKYWENKELIYDFNYQCPECKDGKIGLYDLNGKKVIACSNYGNDCNHYVTKLINTSQKFELKPCRKCPKNHKGYIYKYREDCTSKVLEERCSNPNCKSIRKANKNKKITEGNGKII